MEVIEMIEREAAIVELAKETTLSEYYVRAALGPKGPYMTANQLHLASLAEALKAWEVLKDTSFANEVAEMLLKFIAPADGHWAKVVRDELKKRKVKEKEECTGPLASLRGAIKTHFDKLAELAVAGDGYAAKQMLSLAEFDTPEHCAALDILLSLRLEEKKRQRR